MASAAKNGAFKLWDLTAGRLLHHLALPRSVYMTSLCFNPAEFILAAATTERVVHTHTHTRERERRQALTATAAVPSSASVPFVRACLRVSLSLSSFFFGLVTFIFLRVHASRVPSSPGGAVFCCIVSH